MNSLQVKRPEILIPSPTQMFSASLRVPAIQASMERKSLAEMSLQVHSMAFCFMSRGPRTQDPKSKRYSAQTHHIIIGENGGVKRGEDGIDVNDDIGYGLCDGLLLGR